MVPYAMYKICFLWISFLLKQQWHGNKNILNRIDIESNQIRTLWIGIELLQKISGNTQPLWLHSHCWCSKALMPQELLPQALIAKVCMEVVVVHQAHPLTTRYGSNWNGQKSFQKKLRHLLELALVKLQRINGSDTVRQNMKTGF